MQSHHPASNNKFVYWFSTTIERVLITSYYYSDDYVIPSFFRTTGISSNPEFKIYWFVYKALCWSSTIHYSNQLIGWKQGHSFVILFCFQHSSNSNRRITTNSKTDLYVTSWLCKSEKEINLRTHSLVSVRQCRKQR